jgi:hypothetical protein
MSKYRESNSKNQRSISTKSGNTMSHSGNSNVNINLETDTSALAYAMVCLAHTSGQISDDEFIRAITNFKRLAGKDNEPLPDFLSNQKLLSGQAQTPNSRRDCKRIIDKDNDPWFNLLFNKKTLSN